MKLLRFDKRVEQFRAAGLDVKRDWSAESDGGSSDDGLLMTFPIQERKFLQNNTGNNHGTESKMIEQIPPTTLKTTSPPPQKALIRSIPSTDTLTDEEDDIEVEHKKCSVAPNDPLITEDISTPLKADLVDSNGVRPVNELTNILRQSNILLQRIWRDGCLRLLERVFMLGQSFLLALLGARTSTPSPRESL